MDFNKIALLLHVAEAANKWPSLRPIHDAAIRELQEIASSKSPVTDSAPSDDVEIERRL